MAHAKGDPETWIRQHLRLGQTGVDVGADHGAYTKQMLKAVGVAGRVLAIEPNPERASEWASLQRDYPGLTYRQCAVGGDLGIRRFYLHHELSTFWSALAPISTPIDVQVCSLDEVAWDVLTTEPDLIKIDAQGAEVEILEHASRLLRTCPLWIVEAWPYGLSTAGHSAEALRARLADAGLRVEWADGDLVDPAESDYQRWAATTVATHEHVNWFCWRALTLQATLAGE